MRHIAIFILLSFCLKVIGQQPKSDFEKFAEQYRTKNQNSNANTSGTIPQKDISKHVAAIPVLDRAGVTKIAR